MRFPDSLVAVFDTAVIRQYATHWGDGVMHIDSVRIGLGAAYPGGWSIYQSAITIPVAEPVAQRTEFILALPHIVFRAPADSLLRRSWVIVSIYQVSAGASRMPGNISTYAHSARDLFHSLPAR